MASEIKISEIKKIVRHAKQYNWFDDDLVGAPEEESYNYLQRYISNHILTYGSPTLLRTGLNVQDYSNDLLLIAWRARISRVAENIISNQNPEYNALNITWLRDLVRLSVFEDAPGQARQFILLHGIVLVAEPQIIGLRLDGVAFLVGNTPVIGMTLRRDALDNFWYTLSHEIAHVILHYQ